MKIELVSDHLGYQRERKRLTLKQFEVSRVQYFISTADGEIEATTDNWQPGDELLRRADLGQWKLFVDGVQYGYVSKDKPGAVMLTRRVSDEERDAIATEVEKVVKHKAKVQMPADLSKLQQTDDVDDEEVDEDGE